jgi:hypothetical protein
MNAKTVLATALLVTACSLQTVRAQSPGGAGQLPAPDAAATSAPAVAPQYTLSGWIRGDKYNCCDHADSCCAYGPLGYELFLRAGPSIQIGSGILADSSLTGVSVGGGGRLLLFNCDCAEAWTAELGVTDIMNREHTSPPGITLINVLVPNGVGGSTSTTFGQNGVPGVTLRTVNRCFFDYAGGKEWYLVGSGSTHGPTWRVGFDIGGRWGSESATFNQIEHRTDSILGAYTAAHTDLEIPCGSVLFQAGVRLEYGYTWSEILQSQNNSDMQDISILFSIGMRF